MKYGSVEQLLFPPSKELALTGNLSEYTLLGNWRAILRIAVDSSAGILHMHSKNVIHRDISARNFLVDINRRVTASDFGLSVELPLGHTIHRGKWGDSLPIAWCAPETLQDLRFTTATDVYMFGAFMCELLVRGDLYPGRDLIKEVAVNVIALKNPWRPNIPKFCPKALEKLILSCWETNPVKRPSMSRINTELIELLAEFDAAGKVSELSCGIDPRSITVSPVSETDSLKAEVDHYLPTYKPFNTVE